MTVWPQFHLLNCLAPTLWQEIEIFWKIFLGHLYWKANNVSNRHLCWLYDLCRQLCSFQACRDTQLLNHFKKQIYFPCLFIPIMPVWLFTTPLIPFSIDIFPTQQLQITKESIKRLGRLDPINIYISRHNLKIAVNARYMPSTILWVKLSYNMATEHCSRQCQWYGENWKYTYDPANGFSNSLIQSLLKSFGEELVLKEKKPSIPRHSWPFHEAQATIR